VSGQSAVLMHLEFCCTQVFRRKLQERTYKKTPAQFIIHATPNWTERLLRSLVLEVELVGSRIHKTQKQCAVKGHSAKTGWH
jgi:hypothetical protein